MTMRFAAVLLGALFAAAAAAQDIYEPDGDAATAAPIRFGGDNAQDRTLHLGGADIDWIRFYGIATAPYEATVFGCSAGVGIRLEIVDAAGTSVAGAPVSGTCTASSVVKAFVLGGFGQPDGEYFVRIRDPRASPVAGSYKVRLTQQTAPNAGDIRGIVKDATTMAQIVGARVIGETTGGARITSDYSQPSTGFLLVHNPGTYRLNAEKSGYQPVMDEGPVEVFASTTTTYDILMMPVSSASAPMLSGLGVTQRSPSSLTLAGQLATNGATTTITWEYQRTSAPADPTWQPAGNDVYSHMAGNQAAGTTIGGLACAAIYSLRATAANGTAPDSVVTLTNEPTSACAPAAPALGAFAVGDPDATSVPLSASLSTNGATTTVDWLARRLSPPTESEFSVAATMQYAHVAGAQSIGTTLVGLTCGTQFEFKARAANGTAPNAETSALPATTDACPVASPQLSNLQVVTRTGTSLDISADVLTGGADTMVTLQILDGAVIVAQQTTLLANSAFTQTEHLVRTTLVCGTPYTATAEATNSAGSSGVASIPAATLACAAPILANPRAPVMFRTMTSARLQVDATTNGRPVTVQFERRLPPSMTWTFVANVSLGDSAGAQLAETTATGLECGLAYEFKATLTRTDNATTSATAPFATTACAAPVVVNTTGTPTGTTSATLSANVISNGPQAEARFEIRETGFVEWRPVGTVPLTNSGSSQPAPIQATGLLCEQAHDWRVHVSNATSTVTSGVQSVTTNGCSLIFRSSFE